MSNGQGVIDFKRKMSEVSPRVLEQKMRQENIEKKQEFEKKYGIPLAKKELALKELKERRQSIGFGITLFDRFKPVLMGALLLFLLMGPGLTAIMQIFSISNVFVLTGVIVAGIIIWRRL